jgi:hypothetical protein
VVKFCKFIAALLLLPALWGSVHFLFGFLVDATAGAAWPVVPTACFAAGFGLWVLFYFTGPRPMALYVFAHELSHALAVWLSGGRVSRFKVGAKGGQVVADKTSALIVLAPYLLPLYPVVLGLSWALVVWVQPSWEQAEGLFLFLWGVSWGFHYTFTGSVLKTSQSDFSSQGYFFSFVVIALGNVLLIVGLLWIWLRIYGWGEGAGLWFGRVAAAYTTTAEVLAGLARMIFGLFK